MPDTTLSFTDARLARRMYCMPNGDVVATDVPTPGIFSLARLLNSEEAHKVDC